MLYYAGSVANARLRPKVAVKHLVWFCNVSIFYLRDYHAYINNQPSFWYTALGLRTDSQFSNHKLQNLNLDPFYLQAKKINSDIYTSKSNKSNNLCLNEHSSEVSSVETDVWGNTLLVEDARNDNDINVSVEKLVHLRTVSASNRCKASNHVPAHQCCSIEVAHQWRNSTQCGKYATTKLTIQWHCRACTNLSTFRARTRHHKQDVARQ